jgi:CAAX prenyl protease-like protein
MSNSMQSSDAGKAQSPPNLQALYGPAPSLPPGLWGRWPSLTYLLPFAIYMIFTSGIEGRLEAPPPAEPHLPAAAAESKDVAAKTGEAAAPAKGKEDDEHAAKIPYKYYPTIYTLKIAVTVGAMLLVIPGYLIFQFRINGIAIAMGIFGVVLWIGICKLQLEQKLLVPMGLEWLVGMGARPGFDPLKELADQPNWAYGFLAIRLFGLAIVVPIIEEFFLRGWLMRFVMDVDWFKIPFGAVDRLAIVCGTVVPVLMHPAELFASLVWFSLVTWLMLRTKNIWDCVAAHAVTNALLGAYVLATGEWQFM